MGSCTTLLASAKGSGNPVLRTTTVSASAMAPSRTARRSAKYTGLPFSSAVPIQATCPVCASAAIMPLGATPVAVAHSPSLPKGSSTLFSVKRTPGCTFRRVASRTASALM